MNVVDIAIVAIVLTSLIIGLSRGFVREVLSLFSWIAAIWLAYTYVDVGIIYLQPYIDQQMLRAAAALAGIFVVALILISMLSHLVYRIFAITGISGVDRSLGTLFGLMRGIIVVAILILVAIFMDLVSQPWWHNSLLVNYFNPITDFIRSLLPADIAAAMVTKIV